MPWDLGSPILQGDELALRQIKTIIYQKLSLDNFKKINGVHFTERGWYNIANGGTMENQLNILTWAIAGGFTGTWAMMFYLVKTMCLQMKALEDRIGRLEIKVENLDIKLSTRIDKLTEVVTDIDRRVCRMEGAFANKECCMINDNSQRKKAE